MTVKRILIVGGGIAGLTSAIAFRRKDIAVDLVEINPAWSVYGVGIIQQSNVVRAMAELGLLDKYLGASFPFDRIDLYDPQGHLVGVQKLQPLAGADYPAGLGVSRAALHEVLKSSATQAGAKIRLGVTVDRLEQTGDSVTAHFTDRTAETYDLVIGADGINSQIRRIAFPGAPSRQLSGQSAWRYNFPRPPEVDSMRVVLGGKVGAAGLVPLSQTLMYMYLTSEEPGNPHMPDGELASLLRARLTAFGGLIGRLREQITDSAQVVYRPMEWVLVPQPWYRGSIILIGDAAHATTPHLGQGAGMAIEDSIVLAEEACKPGPVVDALERFMARRWERCQFVVEASLAIGEMELGRRAIHDRDAIFAKMFELTSRPL